MTTKPKTPDEYVAMQPADCQAVLEDLRTLIRNAAPEAEELISYQIICYKFLYMLVGIGTKKGACSLHTMSPGLLESMKAELSGLTYSGATLHFPLDKPLPHEIIRKIVEQRIAENRDRKRKK